MAGKQLVRKRNGDRRRAIAEATARHLATGKEMLGEIVRDAMQDECEMALLIGALPCYAEAKIAPMIRKELAPKPVSVVLDRL
ncbi:MAG: hypothetical protein P8Y58_16015 [Novosphingobium sp.]